jgi:hypothetical protein
MDLRFRPALDLDPGPFFYVLLDGFDLGVGILYTAQHGGRNLLMNSIALDLTAMKPGWCWAASDCWRLSPPFAIIPPAVYFRSGDAAGFGVSRRGV